MSHIIHLGPHKEAEVIHFAPIAVGSEIYRVIYEIRPAGSKVLHKEYEVWVSQTYIKDYQKISNPTQNNILKFTDDYLTKRYRHSNDNIPKEDGAYLTNETGEIRGNPRTFSLKTSDKNRSIKTTLMLPVETHDWIVEYGKQKNIGLGETIRRVVADFQAGTATYGKKDNNN